MLNLESGIDLHPAQARAVEEILAIRGPVWLRGETGCGKTITSIAACQREMRLGDRGLVIVPERMLMEKWVEELRLMGNGAGEVFLLGSKADVERYRRLLIKPRWVVVSYNALSFGPGKALLAERGAWTHMIFDESQKAKSPGAKRVRKWMRYVKESIKALVAVDPGAPRRVLMLSATFVVKEDLDLITQYRVVGLGEELRPVVDYARKQITPEVVVEIPQGWREDLPAGMVARLLRRRRVDLVQADVFPPGLPPMEERDWGLSLGTPMELLRALVEEAVKDDDSDELREQWVQAIAMSLEGEDGWEYWDCLGRLAASLREERRLKCKADTMPMMLWGIFLRAEARLLGPEVAEMVAALDKPAVVFANYIEPLEAMAKALEGRKRTAHYYGNSNARCRANKAALKAGEIDVLLATYSKGGVGVEFTPTPVVVLAQRSPSPADMVQARARIYRMNTKGATYAYTCMGRVGGAPTKMERSLSRIINRKYDAAAKAGLAGTLGRVRMAA